MLCNVDYLFLLFDPLSFILISRQRSFVHGLSILPLFKIKFNFTEQRSPTDDEFEGVLQRKHEWESTTKKASNRSWHKVYMVVRGQSLFVYTDQKSYKAAPDQPYKGESPLDLRGATITVASDYTKKKHVFRVK